MSLLPRFFLIDYIGHAKKFHAQKLMESQDIADAVLDAVVKIGELTSRIEKPKENQYTKKQIDSGGEQQTKAQALAEIGIEQHTIERFDRLVQHPETAQKAKEEAHCKKCRV